MELINWNTLIIDHNIIKLHTMVYKGFQFKFKHVNYCTFQIYLLLFNTRNINSNLT